MEVSMYENIYQFKIDGFVFNSAAYDIFEAKDRFLNNIEIVLNEEINKQFISYHGIKNEFNKE